MTAVGEVYPRRIERRRPLLAYLLRPAAPVLAGVVLVLARAWPIVLHPGSRIGQDLGDPPFEAWQVAWIGHALLHAPLRLFQSNTFWPLPDSLAFSDALIGYAPPALLAQHSPHAALLVYNLLFGFTYVLAFLGAYLLGRELGLGAVGAAMAGVAFAYAPWRSEQDGHLHVLSSGGIPLALFLLVRGYRRRSWRLALAGWVVATWQVTLGFTLGLQLAYLLAALGLIVGVRSLRSGVRPGRALVAATVGGASFFLAVAALLAQPYLRVAQRFPEARRTPAEVAIYSPPLTAFMTGSDRTSIWGRATADLRGKLGFDPDEKALFPGATVLLLAVLGLGGSVYPKRLRIALGAGVVACAVLSLGLRDWKGPERYLLPYRFLYEFAPGWDSVRTPARITTLTSLGLALLAGAGLCVLVRRFARDRRRLAWTFGAVAAGAVFLEGYGALPHPALPPPPRGQLSAPAPQLHLPPSSLEVYWSTAGFPQIVNGVGAFEPLALRTVWKVVESFPDARSVAALRRLGVRSVVLHPGLAQATPWQGAGGRSVRGLPLTREVAGGVVLFHLRPS